MLLLVMNIFVGIVVNYTIQSQRMVFLMCKAMDMTQQELIDISMYMFHTMLPYMMLLSQ